jgi:CheY-like chemotaxis protein
VACILCIDDKHDVLESIAEYLRASGHSTLIALSGKQGLRLLLQNSVDVVEVDYEMPVMNGDLVAQGIRRSKPEVPIILFTGIPDDIPGSVQRNVNAVISKVDFGGLLTAVSKLTKKSLGKPEAT